VTFAAADASNKNFYVSTGKEVVIAYSTAAATTLDGGIDNAVTAFTLISDAGFPSAPFIVLIGTEKILVGARTTTACSSCTRGYQGTTAAAHLTGVDILVVREVTITSTADPYGRTGDVAAESIAALTYRRFGPFPKEAWAQSNGQQWLEASHAEVLLAVITLP